MALAPRNSKKPRSLFFISVSFILIAMLVILVMNLLSSSTRKLTAQQEDPVFNVSDSKADPQYLSSEEQSYPLPKQDPIDNAFFSYDIHGGPPGGFIVHSTCYINEIDYDNLVIVLVGFEKEIEEKLEVDRLAVNCAGSVPTRMEMRFDELYIGEELKFDFLWPQTSSPITGIIRAA